MVSAESPKLVDVLIDRIRANGVRLDGWARPAAILWTDPQHQWTSLVPGLIQTMPELLVLGAYDPEQRTGPAIWLRCVVDGTLDVGLGLEQSIPVIYLPGIGRQDLRSEDIDWAIEPLLELVFRGTMWLHPSGRDWTVSAFLASMDIEVGRDSDTGRALMRALPELFSEPLSSLGERRWGREDLDRMIQPDPVRDLLRWMDAPEAMRQEAIPERWEVLCDWSRARLGFDPQNDGDLRAAELMGTGAGTWAQVWDRYKDSPESYPRIVELLRRAKPHSLVIDPSRWPEVNDQEEAVVREELQRIVSLPHDQLCLELSDLAKRHQVRKDWVWAKLGFAPMAQVLPLLDEIASQVKTSFGGPDITAMANHYMTQAWRVDALVWQAMAMTDVADESLLQAVIHALVSVWLDDSARTFQQLLLSSGIPRTNQEVVVKDGECLVFIDGLRYDVGKTLADRLNRSGYQANLAYRWAALPTVTATAKPAVTPVAHAIVGQILGDDFSPEFADTGLAVNADRLRTAIRNQEFQLIGNDFATAPETANARGWAELGDIDTQGHNLQERFARLLEEEIDRIVLKIQTLLDAGWETVRLVTDHGWLWLPGGLPKVTLPKYLTQSRWSRCAVIAGDSRVDALVAPWHWNEALFYATPPGIACFSASLSYAHGGLSIQECLTPDMVITRGVNRAVAPTIRTVTWRGMRCFVEAGVPSAPTWADLRLDGPQGPSVVTARKPLDRDGTVNLLVADDQYENADLVLVLLDEQGSVSRMQRTKVGVSS